MRYVNIKEMKTKIAILVLMLGTFSMSLHAERLSDEDRATLEQHALEKINDFISYLPEIAAKSNKSYEEKQLAQKYIAKTLELFIGEGNDYEYIDAAGNRRMHPAVTMQTTSRGFANPPQPMKRYLQRLMALPYQTVEVDTCQAVRIHSHLRETGDGWYVGSASFLQVLRATRDGRLVVNDKDLKIVTIYVKRIHIPETGEDIWVVYLGDMRVRSSWK